MIDQLPVAETLRGKHILMTGVTGFIGKTLLAWLACHHPDIGKVTCIVRKKARQSPAERLDKVFEAEALEVMRESLGQALDGWRADKVEAVDGDLSKDLVGLSEADITELTGKVDLFINVAASVDFNPPLDTALQTNTRGALGALDLAKRLGVPLVQVSTCYVAGYVDGAVPELIEPGVCPNDEIEDFDPEAELIRAERLVARIREDRNDPAAPPWRRRLREEGKDRARALGWPNTYTYTKGLAEKLLASRAEGHPFAVVRPAIVESAEHFPLSGWSEGGNGSAAAILMAAMGQRWTPSKPGLALDLIPVDHVVKGLLLVACAILRGEHRSVYHLGSSYENPLHTRRLSELVNVWRHRRLDETDATALERAWVRYSESIAGQRGAYHATSAPAIRAATSKLSGWLRNLPVAPGGIVEHRVKQATSVVMAVERTARGVEAIYETYEPFMHDIDVQYQTRNVAALSRRLSADEAPRYRWSIADLDWYDYFQDVHLPGLERWIYPEMKRKLERGITPDPVLPTPILGDLLDLLERTTALHAHRDFVGRVGTVRPQTLTYAEVLERAEAAGRRLADAGVKPGDRVLLVVNRGPEWAVAYFGALYAGAVAVPLDIGLSSENIRRLGERSQATAWVVSRSLAREHADALPDELVHIAEVLTAPRAEERLPELPSFERDPHRPASILFTSGTTGNPRGVVLTHGNFLAVLRGIQGLYPASAKDRFLSVLPLHHAFEFSAGLLFPVSKGASIYYPGEVNGDTLPLALEQVQPTSMVGVPALWTLLARRINTQLDALPTPARWTLGWAIDTTRKVRDETGINIAPWLLFPIHRGLGGYMRNMVSGGAALPSQVAEDWRRWGFSLSSGYGLTEAAPVLAANRLGSKRLDSVGKPLPGIDVKIFEPGPDGIGEIIARGPNVMAGYLDDPEGTSLVVKRGWLHTGDLGRIDEDGHLVIVGRAKEVIVTSAGENVYPDELETALQEVSGVREIAVVGRPDGVGGERVVVVAVPEDDAVLGDNARESVLRRAVGAATLPFPASWRPSEVVLRDEELPRTATLKVSRKRLSGELALREATLEAERAEAGEIEHKPVPDEARWLSDALARAASREPDEMTLDTSMARSLPIDSLGWVEVVGLVERRLGRCPPPEELMSLETLGDVLEAVGAMRSQRARLAPAVPLFHGPDGQPLASPRVAPKQSTPLPPGVTKEMSRWVKRGHARMSEWLFDVDVVGLGHVPTDRQVLVVSNHTSHVDSGILRHALGALGEDLPLMAAQDYFFGSPLRDLLFGDLLDLIPTDREGTGLTGVRTALRVLDSGRSLVVFPEGTRSEDGSIASFRAGALLIALKGGVDILPVHIGGTFEVLPKGSFLPQSRNARVRIGECIPHALLETQVRDEGLTLQRAADRLRESVICLSRSESSLAPWSDTAARGAR